MHRPTETLKPIIFAVALVLPWPVASQETFSAAAFADIFIHGCLDGLPDFSATADRLESLGFEVTSYEGGLHEAWHPETFVGGSFTAYDDPAVDGAYCELSSENVARPLVYQIIGSEIERRWQVDAAAQATDWQESTGWKLKGDGRELDIIVARAMSDLINIGISLSVTVWR